MSISDDQEILEQGITYIEGISGSRNFPIAVTAFKSCATSLDPDIATQAQFRLVQTYLYLGQTNNAVTQHAKAERTRSLNKGSVSTTTKIQCDVIDAILFLKTGQPQKAEKLLITIVKNSKTANKPTGEAYNLLGCFYEERFHKTGDEKDLRLAADYYRQAVETLAWSGYSYPIHHSLFVSSSRAAAVYKKLPGKCPREKVKEYLQRCQKLLKDKRILDPLAIADHWLRHKHWLKAIVPALKCLRQMRTRHS